jgi:heat-inducible transcriptional repressor
LITFEKPVTQPELTVIAARMSELCAGLSAAAITRKKPEMNPEEQFVTDFICKKMESEDTREYDQPFMDGLHFTLNQPELTRNVMLAQTLTELIEQRSLLKVISPSKITAEGVQVVIGRENGEESIHDYSVVIGRYGITDDALGTLCVIGPTRMPYGRTIATVGYLSVVLSGLIRKLYGGENPVETPQNADE